MSLQRPSSDPQTPPKRGQGEHFLSPDTDPLGEHRRVDSSVGEYPLPTHREWLYTRAQSTPTPVQPGLGKRPRPEAPDLHDAQRPALGKKARSAPDRTAQVGPNITNNDHGKTTNLPKKVIQSPCGKPYTSPGWQKRHEETCRICKEKQQDKDGDSPTAVEKQALPNLYSLRAAEDQQRTEAAANLQEDCEAPEVLGLSRERVLPLHRTVDTTPPNPEIPRSVNNVKSRGRAKDSHNIVYAAQLGLEDDNNPEGALESPSNATELHTKVRTLLETTLTQYDVKGYVYIFFDPKRPKHHKIGRSKNPMERKKQLNYQCGLNLRLVESVPVDYYVRTERLVQTYLSDLRRTYKCSACGAKHGEWFEIAKEPALAAMTQWTNFMIQENPYDSETRQLQPFFNDLIKRRDRLFADAGSRFEVTRDHWKRVLSPSFLDRFLFKFNKMWALLWQFYWPVNTMVAWTVAFVTSRHPITFVLMAISVFGTFISISDEIHRLRSSSVSSKKKSARKGL